MVIHDVAASAANTMLLVTADCADDGVSGNLVQVLDCPGTIDAERVVSPNDVRVTRHRLAGHGQHIHTPWVRVIGPFDMGNTQVMVGGKIAHYTQECLSHRNHGT